MNVRLFAQKIVRSIRDDGVQRSLQKAPHYLRHLRAMDDDFDGRHGTDTGGFEHIWKFRIASDNARFGTHYRATTEQDLVRALARLPENLHRFTFIDLGCGKGRTLIVASRAGCHQVIGVEFAPELAEVARANLATQQIQNAEVLERDAAEYVFPDDPLVVYLYNPFSREVMTQVIDHLRDSRAERIYVVYKNPTYAGDVLDMSGFLARFGPLDRAANIQIWRSLAEVDDDESDDTAA